MLKINVMGLYVFAVSGVIFETAMRMFVSKFCGERHDLCLSFIISNCEKTVSQRHVGAKRINN